MPGRFNGKPANLNAMIFAVYRMGFLERSTVLRFRALALSILSEAVTEVDGNMHRMCSADVVERKLAHPAE